MAATLSPVAGGLAAGIGLALTVSAAMQSVRPPLPARREEPWTKDSKRPGSVERDNARIYGIVSFPYRALRGKAKPLMLLGV